MDRGKFNIGATVSGFVGSVRNARHIVWLPAQKKQGTKKRNSKERERIEK